MSSVKKKTLNICEKIRYACLNVSVSIFTTQTVWINATGLQKMVELIVEIKLLSW